jgi:hypothetical protein
MDLFDIVRACVRRWYVVVPLLLLTGLYTSHVYASVKPVYYSNSVVGFVVPSSVVQLAAPGAVVPRNGLVDSGGPSLLAYMTVIGLNDATFKAQHLNSQGEPLNYTAKMFPVAGNQAQLPLVMIEATGPDSETVSKTVQNATQLADPVLRNLQVTAGVPADQMAKAFVTSGASVPSSGTPSRTKSAISIALAGTALAVLAGLLVDFLVTRFTSARSNRGTGSGLFPERDGAQRDGAQREDALLVARRENVTADSP